jgi:hypothetical protein
MGMIAQACPSKLSRSGQNRLGEAKWLEPTLKLAQNYRLSDRQLRAIEELIREHENEIRAAWQAHFGR